MAAKKSLIEIGPGFWNLRASFTFAFGAIDIGTQMSFLRLNSGKFLVLDTCDVSASTKAEIDELTQNGTLIEAVVATHPYHTMYFTPFHKLYPSPKYYGTPRHIRNNKVVPWAGDINDETVRTQWESEGVEIRIPEGAEFINANDSHFTSAFVFHRESRTLHDDDTIMFFENPGFLLRLAGAKNGGMDLHMTMLKDGLDPTAEAPMQFYNWMEKLLQDWDFDNIAAAHTGVKIGGAKHQLTEILAKYKPKLEELAKKNAAKAKK